MTKEKSKEEIKTIVYEGIGTASMCWSETPSGIFDDATASKVGERIMQGIESHTKQEAIAFAEFLGNYENGKGITPRMENGNITWYFISGESFNKGDTKSVFDLYIKHKEQSTQ